MDRTLFVNGTLMRGLPLQKNLDGAEFLGEFQTKPHYRLFSIGDVHPGMYKVPAGGVAVTGELYRLPDEVWRRVEAGEPPHLYVGKIELADGRVVDGILFPEDKIGPRDVDISKYGGWRQYLASKGS